jgi:SAM-dependent methyltransferase
MADRATRALSFGANAAEYERARPEYPLEAARWLVGDGAETVVEIGAGTGKLTRALAQLGLHVAAVDPDERMLDVLRGLGLRGVETAIGTAEGLPADDGSADAVVAGSAFHWFDLERALPEFARVLRPGGVGVLGFAWNRRDDREPPMELLSELIRGDDASARPRWHDRDWAGLVAASGVFERPERAEFRHVLSLSAAELPDLLRSYSRIGTLPPEEQDVVIARARAALPGERLELPFVVECYRARVLVES